MKDRFNTFDSFDESDASFDDFEQAIPLMSEEEEKELTESIVPDELPILPLKNTVLFPGVVVPITVGRDRSLALVKEAYAGDKIIGVVTQKDEDIEEPEDKDLYRIGTMARIIKLIKMPDGSKSIVIQGKSGFEVEEFTQSSPFFKAKVKAFPKEMDIQGVELDASIRNIKETATRIINLSPNIPSEATIAVNNINSPTFLLNFISSNLNVGIEKKQQLLEIQKFSDNLKKVMEFLEQEVQVLDMSEKIRTKVKSDIDDQQREFYLRQQMKAIQEELGEDAEHQEVEKLKEKLAAKKLPENVREEAEKELRRLEMTPNASPNYGIIHSYVEWILDLPWDEYSEDKLDLNFAKEVLDEDHYGLEKVKKRIIEYLAVLKLKEDMKAPILCFYGPPGVGKTSLGKSIARSLNREFERFSLGGIRDEAEIRGHRRTYIGALPGRIIRSMKKAGKGNPVIMLDEIDKVGSDYRGDPTSALLEVLDPEQNDTFSDNYLELEYDLSKVMFIATANSLDTIPAPLRDRMEIINISGYTLEEKTEIAKKYLIPKQIEENGLKKEQINIDDESIHMIIDQYTRESGVRNLERQVAGVCRGVAAKIAKGEIEEFSVTENDVEEFLGKQKYFSDAAERTTVPGVATGLAWTPFGGDILFIEASVSKGSGKLNITGQLGDVMKESAMLAISYLKAHAETVGIPEEAFKYWDLHIHVPAGAVPKDGPSAGVSLMSAIASIFTQRKVKGTIALTGEITLRGLVLPVGGIKEKVLAAKRAGIKQVFLPKKNEKDVAEIEKEVIGNLKINYLERMEELLDHMLEDKAENDPKEFFKVSDAHKNSVTGKNGKQEMVSTSK
ncbi:MAG: endopeptidase La [Bacteroidetes bacterium]|jgi:ATP-dependent Lon protease|nr:endopeptidase La [Bacteroidota bacterium]MAC06680.1 endopeptidase La [Balneola sp.]MAO76876.1 endopeptidase La [Balneola sp.]MBF65695.1 endopeptidase La [Balneola sp.]HBZ38031.1 endopeptidase La [Balneola sp.]|tara:strand:+ start:9987 stop:12512 length:2526 start_codon:yes stop_codon:yes gene_type:complete